MTGIIMLSYVLAVTITGKYTTKYDDTDVKSIMQKDRPFLILYRARDSN